MLVLHIILGIFSVIMSAALFRKQASTKVRDASIVFTSLTVVSGLTLLLFDASVVRVCVEAVALTTFNILALLSYQRTRKQGGQYGLNQDRQV